jgi:hypothetical protein
LLVNISFFGQTKIFMQFLLLGLVAALAPLEQADGSPIYFGPWYDRLAGDSVEQHNKRIDYKPFSMFQADVNITATLQASSVDEIFTGITGSQTDAVVYLTVYPIEGFDVITDAAVSDLATRVGSLTKDGHRIFIRYASEMVFGFN